MHSSQSHIFPWRLRSPVLFLLSSFRSLDTTRLRDHGLFEKALNINICLIDPRCNLPLLRQSSFSPSSFEQGLSPVAAASASPKKGKKTPTDSEIINDLLLTSPVGEPVQKHDNNDKTPLQAVDKKGSKNDALLSSL